MVEGVAVDNTLHQGEEEGGEERGGEGRNSVTISHQGLTATLVACDNTYVHNCQHFMGTIWSIAHLWWRTIVHLGSVYKLCQV